MTNDNKNVINFVFENLQNKKKTINGDIIIPAVILLMHNKKYKKDIVKNVILDSLSVKKDLKIAPEINKIKDKFNRLYDGVNKFSKQ